MKLPIYRWPHAHWQLRLLGVVQGFADMLDGLIVVGTLGFFAGGFGIQTAVYRAKHYYTLAKKERGRASQNR